MEELRRAKEKESQTEKALEQSIIRLVKELTRLQGEPAYEPTTTELDDVIMGGDDGLGYY